MIVTGYLAAIYVYYNAVQCHVHGGENYGQWIDVGQNFTLSECSQDVLAVIWCVTCSQLTHYINVMYVCIVFAKKMEHLIVRSKGRLLVSCRLTS